MKPASEKIGVRSSCEAVAMNSLRATSTLRSWYCISLKVSVSWPSSSWSHGERLHEAPARHVAGGAFEPAHAPSEPRGHEIAAEERDQERGAGRDENAVAHERTVSRTSSKSRE